MVGGNGSEGGDDGGGGGSGHNNVEWCGDGGGGGDGDEGSSDAVPQILLDGLYIYISHWFVASSIIGCCAAFPSIWH